MTPGPSARSIQRRQRRSGGRFQLNLVALMDVFTILVFFFLAHFSEFTTVDDQQAVSLPESLARQTPRDTLVITVTRQHILVQGEAVADTGASLNSPQSEISGLRSALLRARSDSAAADDDSGGDISGGTRGVDWEVTIMGDKSIPFRLLKKVMLTSSRAGYEHISLSVLQRSTNSG
ncbi:biopolymer transporter ExbD [Motiliproteus coralliicola]|uniref:Biopolymer transporter ExbD n=1 Tax=Motiliproteus coralliicola TaxID=2283196 RepID=A0A369WMK1_9GAMM|nr:biopolymer transporter ExbD [Motiliproteus coralliicola]RDE22942.1 biopolymer transporter ExbD [Motiliproteus coralliicola]